MRGLNKEKLSSISRPEFQYDFGKENALEFMVTHCQYEMDYRLKSWGPVIHVYGVTALGHSVLLKVRNFKPYFKIKPPDRGVKSTDDLREQLEHHLDFALRKNRKEGQIPPSDTGMSITHSITKLHEKPIMGYCLEPSLLYKVELTSPLQIPIARQLFEAGLVYKGKKAETYEANIAYVMRFMVDSKFGGCEWIRIPLFPTTESAISTCNIECDLWNYKDIVPLKRDVIAPIRILSFDIECCKLPEPKGFPHPHIDPVSQIGCSLKVYGQPEEYHHGIVFCLVPFNKGVRLPLTDPNVDVITFESEKELLAAFAEYIVRYADPDVFTGYNVDGFDWWYLFERAKTLLEPRFAILSRLKGRTCRAVRASFNSKAFGAREDYSAKIPGRFTFDMLKYIQRSFKLRSYTLNNVSNHFLKETKIDMPYELIPEYQNGTDDQRAHLSYYCFVDAHLCLRLMDKLMALVNSIEQSRVTGVIPDFLLARGAQIKTLSNLMQFTFAEQYAIPTSTEAENKDKTKGATVLEPTRGFHEDPVCTLDFASLYPSIMQWKNMCYTTKVTKEYARKHLGSNDVYDPIPGTDPPYRFVKPHIHSGILPRMLKMLLGRRKIAKGDLKRETDPFKRAVLDGRQLALKIVANSVYGFVKANMVCDKDLMSAVTGWGRNMISDTKRIAETYPRCKVVYGDTDSVMVKMVGATLEETFAIGEKIAEECTKYFGEPHVLELEKVYWPYLLIGKKKYAGKKYMSKDAKPTLASSGLENVRRDNAKIASVNLEKCLYILLMEGNPKKAIDLVHTVLRDLMLGKTDLSQLIITKGLSKSKKHYEGSVAKQPHAELAKRIAKRSLTTGETVPHTGDRVKYVIVDGHKKDKTSELAEDPLYALQHNRPINVQYYIEKQLLKPLCKIFTPVLAPNETTHKYNRKGERIDKTLNDYKELTAYKVLFEGPHMHAIRVLPIDRTVGIMSMFKQSTKPVKRKCYKCTTIIPVSRLLCNTCSANRQHVKIELEQELEKAQYDHDYAWLKCKVCVKGITDEKMCGNMDCDNFFHRQVVITDLEDVIDKLNTL